MHYYRCFALADSSFCRKREACLVSYDALIGAWWLPSGFAPDVAAVP